MKKSQLRKIIKEEIKSLKETSMGGVERIDDFIEGLEQTISIARKIQTEGENENADFGSLIDSTRDFIREFESIPWDN